MLASRHQNSKAAWEAWREQSRDNLHALMLTRHAELAPVVSVPAC